MLRVFKSAIYQLYMEWGERVSVIGDSISVKSIKWVNILTFQDILINS